MIGNLVMPEQEEVELYKQVQELNRKSVEELRQIVNENQGKVSNRTICFINDLIHEILIG